jgi:hypothetical protein
MALFVADKKAERARGDRAMAQQEEDATAVLRTIRVRPEASMPRLVAVGADHRMVHISNMESESGRVRLPRGDGDDDDDDDRQPPRARAPPPAAAVLQYMEDDESEDDGRGERTRQRGVRKFQVQIAYRSVLYEVPVRWYVLSREQQQLETLYGDDLDAGMTDTPLERVPVGELLPGAYTRTRRTHQEYRVIDCQLRAACSFERDPFCYRRRGACAMLAVPLAVLAHMLRMRWRVLEDALHCACEVYRLGDTVHPLRIFPCVDPVPLASPLGFEQDRAHEPPARQRFLWSVAAPAAQQHADTATVPEPGARRREGPAFESIEQWLALKRREREQETDEHREHRLLVNRLRKRRQRQVRQNAAVPVDLLPFLLAVPPFNEDARNAPARVIGQLVEQLRARFVRRLFGGGGGGGDSHTCRELENALAGTPPSALAGDPHKRRYHFDMQPQCEHFAQLAANVYTQQELFRQACAAMAHACNIRMRTMEARVLALERKLDVAAAAGAADEAARLLRATQPNDAQATQEARNGEEEFVPIGRRPLYFAPAPAVDGRRERRRHKKAKKN